MDKACNQGIRVVNVILEGTEGGGFDVATSDGIHVVVLDVGKRIIWKKVEVIIL